jgi:hypothetical protein
LILDLKTFRDFPAWFRSERERLGQCRQRSRCSVPAASAARNRPQFLKSEGGGGLSPLAVADTLKLCLHEETLKANVFVFTSG